MNFPGTPLGERQRQETKTSGASIYCREKQKRDRYFGICRRRVL